ncbi:hypothetical protein [Streptomyces sp. G-G2]|uniref:hypothetical protein n=1 Tax=Streptomyces sp. G-G2 TaxID=3046201 RepID=UPI0024B99C4D|nr:hypothetical protein [Streptomyces sp. G-G2]MDJ0385183.1 hypothetical protein [Streptomyces sp. G-G2]
MWRRRRDRRAVDEAVEAERRGRAFLEELRLPPVDSVLDLVPFMEERLDRSIRLMPFTPDASDPDALDAAAPCGLWLATESTDYVFYDTGISKPHAEIIVGHEFAHMLRQHRGKASVTTGTLGGLITDIDPGTVQLVLGRTRYNNPEEFEAEMLGSLLQEHVSASHHGPRHTDPADPIARTLLR